MTDTAAPDGVEDHDIDAQVELADKPREATPYERKLRQEAASWRKKANEAEAKSTAAQVQYKADAEAHVLANKTTYTERLTRAELKAHALKAGLQDLDTLKLFDISKAMMADDGSITNADSLIEEWKVAKPHFFGASSSTSSTASAPKQSSSEQTKFSEMSEAEQASFRRQHGVRSH